LEARSGTGTTRDRDCAEHEILPDISAPLHF
jgi:hypothetical protein